MEPRRNAQTLAQGGITAKPRAIRVWIQFPTSNDQPQTKVVSVRSVLDRLEPPRADALVAGRLLRPTGSWVSGFIWIHMCRSRSSRGKESDFLENQNARSSGYRPKRLGRENRQDRDRLFPPVSVTEFPWHPLGPAPYQDARRGNHQKLSLIECATRSSPKNVSLQVSSSAG